MSNLKKIRPATYEIPKTGNMRVPGLIIATEKLIQELDEEKSLEQVRNVAQLQGIVGYSVAMPDIHWGYGFPIGGVAAMDAEEGVISPGGVGYDINCGVRIALVPEAYKNLSEETAEALINKIFEIVPSGVGHGYKERGLSDRDYKEIVETGVKWGIKNGYGFEKDLEHIESRGHIEGGDIEVVSKHAKERGKNQLGSIGSGNHFLEIGEIQEIFIPEIAKEWNMEKGQIYILIHSGSRGFGHQICQDTLDLFIKNKLYEGLPDKQLVCAPIQSDFGKNYFKGMAAAANYAFNNRQRILYGARTAISEILKIAPEDVELLYDVCHNIAKFETHEVDGKEKRVCVHRKGATRAFGPNSEELISSFKKTGQPVLVPGDMGRASFVLAGLGNPIAWKSACHGAGREQSRVQSSKSWKGKDPIKHMEELGVKVLAHSKRTISEEMPNAYKDASDVVDAIEKAGLAKTVARLRPRLVIKG